MANDLESDWKKLNLAEANDEVINFDPDQEDDVQAQVSLCLIGKLNTKNPFNIEAMKQTMHNVWRLSQGLVITELEHPSKQVRFLVEQFSSLLFSFLILGFMFYTLNLLLLF